MQDLSLHILDIAENSVRAGATRIEVELCEDRAADRLDLRISDNGRGMDAEAAQAALRPFTTSRTERSVGLGLSLLAQAAREADGDCQMTSKPGQGTTVAAHFRHSHIDRKPIGDLQGTFETLVTGYPDVDFAFHVKRDGESERFDTRATETDDQNRAETRNTARQEHR